MSLAERSGIDRIQKSWSLAVLIPLFVGFSIIVTLSFAVEREWVAHEEQVREIKTFLVNLSDSLAQHAEDTIDIADADLISVVERLEVDGIEPAALARLDRMLDARVAAEPRFRDINVLGEDGNWLASSRPGKGKNNADREYFRHFRDNPERRAFIGPPIQSRSTGEWVITVSHCFRSANGSFAGVAVAVINASYFVDHYAHYNLGPNSSIALLTTTGTLLARSPWDDLSIGRSLSGGVFNKLRERPAGGYETISVLDGKKRFSGYRRSERYPLVVATSMSKDYALSAWRADACIHITIAVVLAGILSLLGLGLIQNLRRGQAAEEQTREKERLTRHFMHERDVAEQASQAKSRFLAGMSHELRTPLNCILGYAQLLRIEGGLNAKQGERVGTMLEAGKHLLEMIACVLDLSKIETEHVELQAVTFDVTAVAAACLDLVRPAADVKRLTLSVVVAPGTRQEITADPIRVRQVLLNLLGNAVKFTSHGGIELRLRTLPYDSALRIEVADTGPGIPTDQREKLFKDFERLDPEVVSKAEGAGLGLALSSRLAALMGGCLGHDDNPDGGSVFWFELPLNGVATAGTPPFDPPDAESAPTATGTLHVLVVDDAAMNREIASAFLRAADHQVVCVEGGAEAIAAVASTDFDVVLMDVRMPGMDGLEATRRIRALAGIRGQVPIVALTAQAFSEQITACRNAGMNSHLCKPFDQETLLATIVHAAVEGAPAKGKRLYAALVHD